MRVLYIHHTTRELDGSTKALTSILLSYSKLKDFSATIILPDKQGVFQTYSKLGFNVIPIAHRKSVYSNFSGKLSHTRNIIHLILRIILNTIAIIRTIYVARKEKIEIIHTNVSVISIGYYVSKILHIPHVWHLREYGVANMQQRYYFPSNKILIKRLHQQLTYPICITKGIQEHFQLLDAHHSKIIYDGVFHADEKTFIKQKSKYFLFAGRLEKAKGIEDLLQAYSIFVRHNNGTTSFRLKIAGDAINEDYKTMLLHLTCKLHISEYVDFMGFQTDISSLEQEAYCVVVPSHSEGFGFVMAESMIKGALVIGNNNTGTKEQFDNGLNITGNEIGVRYTTVEELAHCLIQIVEDGLENYTDYIRRGQQTAAKLYTIENNVNSIYHYYQKILSK